VQQERAQPSISQARDAKRLWGLDVCELHDRRWATKGVQVVRPGGPPTDPKGPDLFLLVGSSDLLEFPIEPLVRRLNWLRSGFMRVRVSDARSRYEERILADEDGRFEGFRRVYDSRLGGARRAGITGSRKIADQWRTGRGGFAGWRSLSNHARRNGAGPRFAPGVTRGLVFSADAEASTDDYLAHLQRTWLAPSAAIDGVYTFSPGVLLHESVEIPERARLVGPVWVGAGARIRAGQVVIGPRSLADDESAAPEQQPVDWGSLRQPGWRLAPRARGWRFRSSKRLFDIGFSLAVILATLPIYPVAMLAILIEDGWPPFFAHRRQTIRGREFPCLKFRTMFKNAEQMKAQIAVKNQADGPQFFIDDDPRILRSGKILRRFQIDELPQFWNVLLGHMSVVGPRPSPDKENQFCPSWREGRLSVRPGVTGLWQVRRTRQPETDFQEWIRYDLEYVQHESWRLDLWIILKTIDRVFRGEDRST